MATDSVAAQNWLVVLASFYRDELFQASPYNTIPFKLLKSYSIKAPSLKRENSTIFWLLVWSASKYLLMYIEFGFCWQSNILLFVNYLDDLGQFCTIPPTNIHKNCPVIGLRHKCLNVLYWTEVASVLHESMKLAIKFGKTRHCN